MRKTTKIVVSLLLTLCMLLPMSSMLVFAEEGSTDLQAKFQDAVSGDTVTIESVDEFKAFAEVSKTKDFAGVTVKLMNDLVFNTGYSVKWQDAAPANATWTSVGAPGDYAFKGTFDGNGKTMSGVYINATDSATGAAAGVFSAIGDGAVVKDLAVVNSYMQTTVTKYIGGIIGKVEGTDVTVSGCYSSANIKTYSNIYTGGIIGYSNAKNLTIDGCVFAGLVFYYGVSGYRSGGIIGASGEAEASANVKLTITNCVNLGSIRSGNWAATLFGTASTLTMSNCLNYGYSWSSTGVRNALLGAYRSSDYKTATATWTVSNCYLLTDTSWTTTALQQKLTAASDTTDQTHTMAIVPSNVSCASKATSDVKGATPDATYTSENWTVRTDKLPMPKKAYDNFAKYIDLYDTVIPAEDRTDAIDSIVALKVFGECYFASKTTFDIYSGPEFYALAKALNLIKTAAPTITLKADIVLNEGDAEDWATNPPAYKWDTIGGLNGSSFYFTGTLNGNGHTISGLYLNQTDTSSGDKAVGLFAVLGANATVKNLAIVNSYVNNAKVYAGTIAGRVNGDKASISNCYVDAIVSDQNGSGDGAGIFVGFCSNTNFTITGSVAAGTVKSGNGAGGFIGMNPSYNASSLDWNPAITDCVNLATVTGGSAGAFIGRDLNATITRCINLGLTMSGNYATNALIGGVAATNAAATKSVVTITDSYIFTDFNQAALGRIYQSGTVAIPTTDHDLSVTTIAKLSSIKGTAAAEVLTALDFAGEYSNKTDWVTRTGDYPLPKYIAETFAGVLCDTNALVNESLAKIKYLNAYEGGVREFEIASEDDLIMVAELLNGGSFTNNGLGVTFKLTDNIVFNEGWDAATKTAPEYAWTPIANFRGTFDGQGHTISGLYINNTGSYVGFINVALESACVEDLAIINSYYVNTSSSGYMGGIFGRINAKNVSVSGCYSEAIMTGAARIGGFVGLVTNTVAQTNGDPETAAKLTACVFDGTITSSGGHVGGIVATTGVYDGTNAEKTGAWHNITFVDCANYGTVEYTSTGAISTGAIIGWIQGANNVSLTRCLNFGDVKTNSTSTDTRDGALVGRIQNNSNYGITITDSYIFTDLGQKYLFDNASIDWCNQPSYTINGVSNTPNTTGKTDDPAADHIQAIIANSSLYTIADSNTLKTKLLEGYDNWTLRNYYSKDFQYPMPTRVYENFFKSQLVGYQATPVKKMGVVKSYTLRLIAELDSTNYYNAGFTIKATINGVTKTMTVNTDMVDANGNKYVGVYNTITSNTGETYTAREGNCLITITITELPISAAEFEVTVFTNGATDDSRSASTTQTVNFNSSYEVVEN